LEAEIVLLRHQLNVMQRRSPKRVTLSSVDRLLLVALYRLAPGVLDALNDHASKGNPTYCSANDAWACSEACR
jgi:hypothetical protein